LRKPRNFFQIRWKQHSLRRENSQYSSTTLLALRQNGRLQALTQRSGQLIDLVIAVYLDRLLRRPHRDHAVLASLQMLLQFGYKTSRNLVIQKIAELRQKL
jgi:hypothetical protein